MGTVHRGDYSDVGQPSVRERRRRTDRRRKRVGPAGKRSGKGTRRIEGGAGSSAAPPRSGPRASSMWSFLAFELVRSGSPNQHGSEKYFVSPTGGLSIGEAATRASGPCRRT